MPPTSLKTSPGAFEASFAAEVLLVKTASQDTVVTRTSSNGRFSKNASGAEKASKNPEEAKKSSRNLVAFSKTRG